MIKQRCAVLALLVVLMIFPSAIGGVETPQSSISGFYKGALGEKLEVVFAIRAEAGRISGSYFYAHIGKDIPVTGTIQPSGELRLEEYGEQGRRTGIWSGTVHSPDKISGTWKALHSQTALPFTLTRVERHDVEAAKRPRGGLPQPQEGRSAGIEFRMLPVRETGIQFPKLTHYRDPGVLARVNQQIDQSTADFGCDPTLTEGKGDFHVNASVHYAAQDIFSIYALASYYCGGPYPTTDANMSVTFDLKTGKKVEFSELFKNYAVNTGKILQIIFARQVERAKRGQRLPKKSDHATTDSSSCAEHPELFSLAHLKASAFHFSFSKAGLEVQPEWPHALAGCAEQVTVPYAKLKAYAAPGSLLARVLER